MLTTLKGPVAEKEESEARPGTGRAERQRYDAVARYNDRFQGRRPLRYANPMKDPDLYVNVPGERECV